MYKFKFTDVLKYAFLKTILTCILIVITNAFNKEGNQQMVGLVIIVGILSLVIIYLLLLAIQKIGIKGIYYSFFLIVLVLIINELIGIVIERSTNIFAVIINGKPWQVAYKICDIVSVILSSYVCLVLPMQTRRSS